jgi:hypothetical protein
MKQVRELSDTSVSIVLNEKREHVATVQTRHAKSGSVQCDVWSIAPGDKHLTLTHQKKVSGYGYDKAAAALAGAVIDGVGIADHCGKSDPNTETLKSWIWDTYNHAVNNSLPLEAIHVKARDNGFSFTNWSSYEGRYLSLHVVSGLDRLERIGYTVIQGL